MALQVTKIVAREIVDSRDNPTVEVDVTLSDGSMGRAAVPSGASTGSHEALELRDNDMHRYGGMGVQKALSQVKGPIVGLLVGKEWTQETLDRAMIDLDGTPNKSNLGANSILAVSMAFAKALAQSEKKPLYEYFKLLGEGEEMSLPVPMMNIINGGKHAEHSTDVQEFMIVPHGALTFAEALRYGTEVFDELHKILESRGLNTNVGDEGGYAPLLETNESAIEIILEAIVNSGYKPGTDISLALDIAASELYSDGMYHLKTEHKTLSGEEMIHLYTDWVEKFPIVSIEDGLFEDDWDGWKLMTEKLAKTQIVGDDLFVTNMERLKKGIDEKAANAILIKFNQVGTITETIRTLRTAQEALYGTIVSHRSGETEDTTIADFSVGLSAGQIKTGSLSRGERTAKYNQLLRIEEELQGKATYAGGKIFNKKQ